MPVGMRSSASMATIWSCALPHHRLEGKANAHLLKYLAKVFGVGRNQIEITTGKKAHIYELARKSYFAVLDEGDGGEQDFIHTEQFILIDKNQQIRGFYDGTDATEIERIIKDIEVLKSEDWDYGFRLLWLNSCFVIIISFKQIFLRNFA